jgi:hypothetical protein
MTDKEKIELIIQEKHLNNTQFCNEVCIAPGTLSHILNGRTQPTLNILRSIVLAFPDINPAWLFYGEEPMYKNSDSPTPEDGETDDSYLNKEQEGALNDEEGQLSLFASAPATVKGNAYAPSSTVLAQGTGGTRRTSAQVPVQAASLNVQDIVAETLKQQQKPPRKVVEVRIFFDDGTFETFSAN